MTEPAFMQNKITCIVCKNQVKYVADSPIYYGHEIEGEQSFYFGSPFYDVRLDKDEMVWWS